jgi:tight adherence protein B
VVTLAVAFVGPLACAALVTAGHRAAVSERVRTLGPRSRWRIPARWREWIVGALADADVPWEPEQAVEYWLIGVAGAGIFAAALAPTLVVPAIAATIAAGPVALRLARSRRERAFVAGLPHVLEQIAADLRGGGTVVTAIERVAAGSGAVAGDLRRVLVRTHLGLPLAEALARWPAEHDAVGVRATAGALSVAAALGGRAADAVGGLAASRRHRLDAIAEARALSAQARLSAVVVGAAPLGYLAFSAMVDPRAVTALIDTGVGRVCLAIGLGLEALAALWIRRILDSA